MTAHHIIKWSDPCSLRSPSATIVIPVPIAIAPARVVVHAVIFDGVVARVR
jgi:hypothetical protein